VTDQAGKLRLRRRALFIEVIPPPTKRLIPVWAALCDFNVSAEDREHGARAQRESKVDPAQLPGPSALGNSGSGRSACGGEPGDLGRRRHPDIGRLTMARIPRLQRSHPIRLDVPRDVMYWAGTWGLTDQELRDAVAAVGPIPTDVAAYLGQPLEGEYLGGRFPRRD
jgi:hypothetical protein